MKKLTYKDAINILPAVVDNEASEQEKKNFFSFIEQNREVRCEYENALRIKRLIASRLPRQHAPPHLRENILRCIQNLESDTQIGTTARPSIPAIRSIGLGLRKHLIKEKSLYYRFAFAAAVILAISLSTFRLLDQSTYYPPSELLSEREFVVETLAAEHFLKHGGSMIEPHFATSERQEAEEYLVDHFGLEMTIPAVTGTRFAGLVMAEFSPGFTTPLLAYTQEEIGEIIYLFAFDMDHMESHENLVRHDEAAEACIHHSDYHVAEVNNHHVVSWLWDNTWYAAVSNHNGYDLAALVEPLWE